LIAHHAPTRSGRDGGTAVTSKFHEHRDNLLSRYVLPFLHEYRLAEIDYAVLSAFVAHKLERNQEVARPGEAGVTLRDGRGQPRRPLGPRTINMSMEVISLVLADAVKRGILPSNPAPDRQLRLRVTQRKGNFLEADELLAVIEAAAGIDDPVSRETMGPANLVRRMRGDGRAWKEIAAESTAIWLASRYRKEGQPSARRAILATLGCASPPKEKVPDLQALSRSMELAGLEPATSWVRSIWGALLRDRDSGNRTVIGHIVGRWTAGVACSCVRGVPCDPTAGW